MGFSKFISAILLSLLLLSCLDISSADPRSTIAALSCNSTIAYSGEILANNFIPAMSNLSSLISQNGYGTTKVGQDPNALYALAQCYKDLSSIDCRLCFSEIRSMLPTCYPRTGGRIFLDGCFGRFENFPFFDLGLDSVVIKNCSNEKNSQFDEFGQLLRKVTENVGLKAVKDKGFVLESGFKSNISVYLLAQCWDSLNDGNCSSCLEAAANLVISCSPSVEGRVLNAGCYMRYSKEIFWNLDQSNEKSSGKKNKYAWIIISLVIVLCLILTVIGLWKVKACLRRPRSNSMEDSCRTDLRITVIHSELNIKYHDLKRATNNFDSSNKLGQGSYGTVYKGILFDGKEVAVKRLFLNTRQWVDQFVNEVNLVNQVRHKNLVKLLACSMDGPESLLVYDYYFNKSLDNFIFDKSQAKILEWPKRFDIIQGVADGLRYLHEESDIHILHRDIKASNILLDATFKAKITDFGLARSFSHDQSHLSTGIAGTLGYMAPEYVVHGHLTEKADVYSFGILTLEIVTGLRCNNGIGAKSGHHFLAKIWSHYKAKTLKRIIDRTFYEEAFEDDILRVVHVGLLCVQSTPCYRPTMAKIVELLRNNTNHIRDMIITDPPFLDVLALDILEDGEEEGSSFATGPSYCESSGSLLNGR